MGPLTQKFGIGLEAEGSFSPEPPSHPNGCHVCEVEVDPETGVVTLERYHMIDDLGRILNPMIVLGQQQGGTVQGMGQALMEHQVYDRSSRPAPHRQLHGLRDAEGLGAAVDRRQDGGDRLRHPLGVGIGESGTIGAADHHSTPRHLNERNHAFLLDMFGTASLRSGHHTRSS